MGDVKMVRFLKFLTIAISVVTICFVLLVAGGLVLVRTLASSAYARAVVAKVMTADMSCSVDQILDGTDKIPQLRNGMLQRIHKVREEGGYQLWSTPQGEFWYGEAPDRQDAFVLAEEEVDLYRTDRIKPGSVVLDCGANYGTFTRRALDRGAAKVVAIEIDPREQAALRRTFAKEIQEGRVIVYGKGVWDQETDLDLRGDSVVLPRDQAPERLPVTTIDQIVAELQLPSVDFIKMDIEGAEKNALRGAGKTLARFSPVMAISSEHLPDDKQAIPALVNSLVPGRYRMQYGYCFYITAFHPYPNVLHFSR